MGYIAYGRMVIAFSLDTGAMLASFVGDKIDPFVSRCGCGAAVRPPPLLFAPLAPAILVTLTCNQPGSAPM